MLRIADQQMSLWDVVLPPEVFRLPDELARIDAYFDDVRSVAPWRGLFDARLGRAWVSVDRLLRLLYLAGPAIEKVIDVTGRIPATVVGDRGFGTAANDRALAALGVRHIGLQRGGTLSNTRGEHERTRSFRRMRNWRVGVEARISHLKRGFGLGHTHTPP
jgi:IS5 family transposase